MSKITYDAALDRLLAHEGTYTNHPSDPGGPTNFGITIYDAQKYAAEFGWISGRKISAATIPPVVAAEGAVVVDTTGQERREMAAVGLSLSHTPLRDNGQTIRKTLMNPNIEQYLMIVRWLLSVGGPLGAYLVSRGVPADQVTGLQTAVIAIIGALPPLISFLWGLQAHTEAKAVAVVDAIAKQPNSPVKGVITEATVAGEALAKALPGTTTSVAGTPAATATAKM